ncbi:MAG: DeoR/GlpR family DNA-binding transcription regulator [Pseudomonadota bacterium]
MTAAIPPTEADDVLDRQEAIAAMVQRSGRVTVELLAQQFAVTPQTIRKDLQDLQSRRRVKRVHGGAVRPSGTTNVEYDNRRRLASREKAAIAAAVAEILPDGASVFINIGTTTEAVSEALFSHRGLMVVTNNINVADRMRHNPDAEVVIAGGVVRGSDGGIVGEAASDFIRGFKTDYAIIGVSAVDEDGALLDFDFREVKVAQAIIASAHHVILVADGQKFGRRAPVRLAHVSDIDTFVTTLAPDPIRRLCADGGTTLIETQSERLG